MEDFDAGRSAAYSRVSTNKKYQLAMLDKDIST